MNNPVSTRLGGRPLAMAPRALDNLLAASPLLDAHPTMFPARTAAPMASPVVTDAGIAVVPILGPMVTRSDWITHLLGASDYGEIGDAVEAALTDPSARAVVLELDSPGGEVGGLFDLVDRITALRDAAQKPLWAVARESALSAAYAIASIADRLYITRTAEVGSIGVIAMHVDESGADIMAGLKWTLVHAGDRKIDGHAHAPLSEGAFQAMKADVDALHADLVMLVARNRNISPDAVRATQAAIYRGPRGIAVGLADSLGTVDLALADLAGMLDAPHPTTGTPHRAHSHHPSRRKTLMSTETHATEDDTLFPETGASDPEPPQTAQSATLPPEAQQSEVQQPEIPSGVPVTVPQTTDIPTTTTMPASGKTAEQLRAEYAEIAAIAAQGARLGVTIDAADAMAKGVAPHALRRSILDALAARADASTLVAVAPTPTSTPAQTSAQTPTGTPGSRDGESPIVRRARERASATRT